MILLPYSLKYARPLTYIKHDVSRFVEAIALKAYAVTDNSPNAPQSMAELADLDQHQLHVNCKIPLAYIRRGNVKGLALSPYDKLASKKADSCSLNLSNKAFELLANRLCVNYSEFIRQFRLSFSFECCCSKQINF